MITRLEENDLDKKRNWIPELDEVILANTIIGPRIKIGDGVTKLSDLSYIDQKVIEKIANMSIESYAFHKDDFTDIDKKMENLDKKLERRSIILYILAFITMMWVFIATVDFKIMFI